MKKLNLINIVVVVSALTSNQFVYANNAYGTGNNIVGSNNDNNVLGDSNLISHSPHTNILGNNNEVTDINNNGSSSSDKTNILGSENKIGAGVDNIAVGNRNEIRGLEENKGNILVGSDSSITHATNSMGLGNHTKVTGSNSVALGNESVADRQNTVSVGKVGMERQITNVAEGKLGTDAVNVDQLNDVKNNVSAIANRVTNNEQKIDNNSGEINKLDNKVTSNEIKINNNAAEINKLDNKVNSNEQKIDKNSSDIVQIKNQFNKFSEFNEAIDSKFQSIHDEIKDNRDEARAGIASAMAMSSIPQPYESNSGMMGMAVSGYKGEFAVAIGASRISENGKWITKLNASSNSQRDYGLSVGVGYQF